MKLLNPQIPDPQDPVQALDLFLSDVQSIHEYDYGDCMREWNHDLLYLRDHLQNTSSWALQKINEMQLYVQFFPNWDVESTRSRIQRDALELREHLLMLKNSGRAA